MNRFLIAAFGAAIVAVSPAHAQTNCVTTPAQLRVAAAAAAPDVQRNALMMISTGERLCAVDATAEAGKKFAAAARALGTTTASLPAASTTASAQ